MTGHFEAVGSIAESAEMWSRQSSGEKQANRNLSGHRNDKGERRREAFVPQESAMNINGNKELNVKVLNPNFCCPSWSWGVGAERGCQNRGIGRALFVLFPGVGVGGLPEGSARKSSFVPE